jgi:apolipoprotein N-acyltransferase
VLGPFPAVAGQHSNTATVNARGQTSGTAVTDADAAHYVASTITVAEIPTLSQWGAVLLSALLGLLAVAALRAQGRR